MEAIWLPSFTALSTQANALPAAAVPVGIIFASLSCKELGKEGITLLSVECPAIVADALSQATESTITKEDVADCVVTCGSIQLNAKLRLSDPAQAAVVKAAVADGTAISKYVEEVLQEKVIELLAPSMGPVSSSPAPASIPAPSGSSPVPSSTPGPSGPTATPAPGTSSPALVSNPEEQTTDTVQISPVSQPSSSQPSVTITQLPSPADAPATLSPQVTTQSSQPASGERVTTGPTTSSTPVATGSPQTGATDFVSLDTTGSAAVPATVEQKAASRLPDQGTIIIAGSKLVPQGLATGVTIASSTMATVTALVTMASSVASKFSAAAAASVTEGSNVVVTIATAAQKSAAAVQSAGAGPFASAAAQSMKAGSFATAAAQQAQQVGTALRAPNMQALSKAASKGNGLGLMFTLDQMQSIGAAGLMAPADLPGFRAVAGSMEWTVQLPVPFWDFTGGWNGCIIAGSLAVHLQAAAAHLRSKLPSMHASPCEPCHCKRAWLHMRDLHQCIPPWLHAPATPTLMPAARPDRHTLLLPPQAPLKSQAQLSQQRRRSSATLTWLPPTWATSACWPWSASSSTAW